MPFVDAPGHIHYLIFYTAFTHIVYSVIVYFFGRLHTSCAQMGKDGFEGGFHFCLCINLYQDVEIKSYEERMYGRVGPGSFSAAMGCAVSVTRSLCQSASFMSSRIN